MQVMSSSFALKRIGIFNSRPSTQSQSSSPGKQKGRPLNICPISRNSRQSARKLCLFYGKVRKSTDLSGQFSLPSAAVATITAEEEPSASSLSSVVFLKLNQLGKRECGAEPRSSEVLVTYNICKHVKLL